MIGYKNPFIYPSEILYQYCNKQKLVDLPCRVILPIVRYVDARLGAGCYALRQLTQARVAGTSVQRFVVRDVTWVA
jgi:hypothetical protein